MYVSKTCTSKLTFNQLTCLVLLHLSLLTMIYIFIFLFLGTLCLNSLCPRVMPIVVTATQVIAIFIYYFHINSVKSH